jgi:hypothetical protein
VSTVISRKKIVMDTCIAKHAFRGKGRATLFLAATAGIALLLSAAALAAEPATPEKGDKEKDSAASTTSFVRLTRDDRKSPVALETAIVRHRAKTSQGELTVDLVAALHIAEKSYYDQLNREFASYDAVLYELVAPEDRNVPKPGESGGHHPVSMVQNGMKDLLGLEFQLKAINYARKNMVHADMSPEQFAESMEQRGESMMTMFARMMGYAMAKQNQSSDVMSGGELFMALFDKNRALALKRIMAQQFEEGDDMLAALDGPNGSTLITGRNEVAIEVLRKQIASGKKKMAIFYGAGHMPDMQKRLRDGFHLEPVDTRWLKAWELASSPENAVESKDAANRKGAVKPKDAAKPKQKH